MFLSILYSMYQGYIHSGQEVPICHAERIILMRVYLSACILGFSFTSKSLWEAGKIRRYHRRQYSNRPDCTEAKFLVHQNVTLSV